MNRNLLTIFGLGIFLAGTVLVARTIAEPGQPVKAQPASSIAIIDLVRIFQECAQIKDLNAMMKAKQQEIQAEAEQRREIIQKKQSELTAFTRGTPDFEARRKDLMRLTIEANVWAQAMEQDVELEKFDWTRVVYEEAMKVCATLSREKGYNVVLHYKDFRPDEIEQSHAAIRRVIQDRNIVHFSPERDITDAVIRRLDSDYNAKGGKRQLNTAAAPMP